jgi:hypothetical protein
MAGLPDEVHFDLLSQHIRRALIRELGASKVDVWLGKDGLVEYRADELAVIVVAALEPVLMSEDVRARIELLYSEGVLAPELKATPGDW